MTAQEYLQEHGITDKTVKEFNLTWDDNYINIPVKDENGEELFLKSRNLNYTKDSKEPKYRNPTNSHATLFNYHAVKDSPNILLCEGEFDCMRLTQGGIPATTSTGGANTFLPEWAELFKGKNVWVVFDNDEAGEKGTRKVLELIPTARVITLPEGTKDVCEYFAKYTKKDFVQLMRSAPNKEEWETSHMPEDFKLLPISEITKMAFDPHPWLVDNILYNEGFCFLYGAEGTGKSYLALSIAQAVATGTDWLGNFKVAEPANVLVLDKENPLSMVSKRANGLGMCNIKNIHYLKYPEKFSLSNDKGNISEFAQALATIAQKENIKLIIVDSFIDLMVGKESSSEDTQIFFNALRSLFPKLAFLVLHHENKPASGVIRNDSQRLRGSSNLNAQTFTAFRLEAIAKSKTEMTIKQVKARDALKLDKFMVRMELDKLADNSTTVKGFTYLGTIEETEENKIDEGRELLKELLEVEKYATRQRIMDVASQKGISQATIRRAIEEALEKCTLSKSKKGKEVIYALNMFSETTDPNEIFDGNLDDFND